MLEIQANAAAPQGSDKIWCKRQEFPDLLLPAGRICRPGTHNLCGFVGRLAMWKSPDNRARQAISRISEDSWTTMFAAGNAARFDPGGIA